MQESTFSDEQPRESWCRRFINNVVDYFECDRILRDAEQTHQEELTDQSFTYVLEEELKKQEGRPWEDQTKRRHAPVWLSRQCFLNLICCREGDVEASDNITQSSKDIQLRQDTVISENEVKNEKALAMEYDEKSVPASIPAAVEELVAFEPKIKTKSAKKSGMADTFTAGFGTRNDISSDLNSQNDFSHELQTVKVDVKKKQKTNTRNKVIVGERANSSLVVVNHLLSQKEEPSPFIYYDNLEEDHIPQQKLEDNELAGIKPVTEIIVRPQSSQSSIFQPTLFQNFAKAEVKQEETPAEDPASDNIVFKISEGDGNRAGRRKYRPIKEATKIVDSTPSAIEAPIMINKIPEQAVEEEQVKEQIKPPRRRKFQSNLVALEQVAKIDLTDEPKVQKKRKFQRQAADEEIEID